MALDQDYIDELEAQFRDHDLSDDLDICIYADNCDQWDPAISDLLESMRIEIDFSEYLRDTDFLSANYIEYAVAATLPSLDACHWVLRDIKAGYYDDDPMKDDALIAVEDLIGVLDDSVNHFYENYDCDMDSCTPAEDKLEELYEEWVEKRNDR